MCFYKEDKLLAKRAFSKYMRARNPESAQTEQAPTQKPEVKDPELEDFLQRKKQALEETKPQQHLELPGLVIPPHHTSTEVSDNSDRNLDSPVESVVQPNYFISPNMMSSVVPNLAVQNANNLLTNIALQNLLLQRTQISSPPVNMFHNFHNVNIPTSINFPAPFTANIIKPTFEQPRPCFDETLNQEIFQMISHNANVINQLIESQEQTEAKMQHCIVELRKINEEMVPMQEECPLQVARIQEARLEAERHNNNPTPATLFRHLFGAKNYKYELVLTNTIQTPLLKDKNVVLKIQLINSISGEIVHNTNKIHLQVLLQTWEIPSTNITRNKNGNKAVTGQTETDLKEGQARLDRVQISEVTSKFMNGYVAMVVVPKQPSNHGTYIVDEEEQENFVNFEDVKPLMLEKIVVKSKKKPYL